MMFSMLKEPVWIQIPCCIPILRDWVCMIPTNNSSTPRADYESMSKLCPKGSFSNGGKCYTFDTVITDRNETFDPLFSIEESEGHSLVKIMQHFGTTLQHYVYITIFIHKHTKFYKAPVTDDVVYGSMTQATVNVYEISKLKFYCMQGFYQCPEGACISDLHICDGNLDCKNGEDEKEPFCLCSVNGVTESNGAYCHNTCNMDNCMCNVMFRQLPQGGCKHYRPHDKSKENADTYRCKNGEIIPVHYVDDLVPDCAGDEDEPEYAFTLKNHYKNTSCKGHRLPCLAGHSRCFDTHNLCHYETDEYGNIMYCRNGGHLQYCEMFPCSNSYKCRNSYCIAYSRVCDGVVDCPFGDDEQTCDNYHCKNMLQCKDKYMICVHPTNICDGITHCQAGEDELYCSSVICPKLCICLGSAVQCPSRLSNMPNVPSYTRLLSISGTNISTLQNTLLFMENMETLLSSNNALHDVCYNTIYNHHPYTYMVTLNHLDLSENVISQLKQDCFHGLVSLIDLNLTHNDIAFITAKPFLSLYNLKSLDLSINNIIFISENLLHGITQLDILNLEGNQLLQVSINMIGEETAVNHFYIDDYRLCCLVTHHDTQCHSSKGTQSSCSSLIGNKVVYVLICLLFTACITLNIASFIFHICQRSRNPHDYTIFMLAVSDLLAGIYVFTIILADGYYGNQYSLLSPSWRSNIFCHLATFLSAQSFLFQKICLAILALIRHNAIIKTHQSMSFIMSHFSILLTLLFVLTSVIHIGIILQGYLTITYFLQPSDICTMLLASSKESQVMFSVSVLSIMISFLCLICMGICYSLIYLHTKKIKKAVSEVGDLSQKKTSKGVLTRLLLTMASHFFSVVPLIILIIIKNTDAIISQSVITFSVMLLLPLNAITDPVVYTFSSSTFIQKIKQYMRS